MGDGCHAPCPHRPRLNSFDALVLLLLRLPSILTSLIAANDVRVEYFFCLSFFPLFFCIIGMFEFEQQLWMNLPVRVFVWVSAQVEINKNWSGGGGGRVVGLLGPANKFCINEIANM